MSVFYRLTTSAGRLIRRHAWLREAAQRFAEPLFNMLYNARGLEWTINGVRCRIDPRYRAVMHPEYDSVIADYLRSRIRPGQVCVDVGANIGAWVIQFANAVGPNGRVIAFEPNPTARKALTRHIELNNLGSIVQVVPAAVGSSNGSVEFFAAGADGMSRVGEANPLIVDTAIPITVSMVTLDQWCSENRVTPNWLFIDVEGFEAHAIAGATELIRSAGLQLEIILEMHPTLWQASGTSAAQVSEQIKAIGRCPIPLNGQADVYAEYGHVILKPINDSDYTN